MTESVITTPQAEAKEEVSTETLAPEAGKMENTTILGESDANFKAEEEAPEAINISDYIPEDLKESSVLANVKSIDQLVRGYESSQRMVGKKFEDLTSEQYDQYFTKMGRPEKAEGYELSEVNADYLADADVNTFKDIAHKSGLSSTQAQTFIETYQSKIESDTTQAQADQEIADRANLNEVKDMFGINFDREVKETNKAISFLGGEGLLNIITEAGLASNPTVIKAFNKAASLIREDSIVKGDSEGAGFAREVKDIESEIHKLQNDPEFQKQLTDHSNQPAMNAAKAKLVELYKLKR